MRVYCIISDERAFQLKSPVMFTRVIKKLGINGTYVPFKVAPKDIGHAIQSLRILNIQGANITLPYKETVIPYLDILSEGANIIGAVNTIVRNENQLKGYNTNAIGIMDALSDIGYETEGKNALVIGTGGAAKAAVFMMNWLRTRSIEVVGRDPIKTQDMVNRFSGKALSLSDLTQGPISADIIINATSVSAAEESPELSEIVGRLELQNCELVFDLNYGREHNIWEQLANRNNCQFMDGLKPLAYQARRTFTLWTGMQVPPEEFINAI